MVLSKINLEKYSNKLLYLVSQKPTVFKYSLIALALSSIFLVWLFLFIKPINAGLKFNKAKLKQLNNLKQICAQSYDDCSYLSEKVEHLTAKIDKKINIIGSGSAYRGLGRVIECINCNGVKLIDYSPGKIEKIANKNKQSLDRNRIDSSNFDESEVASQKIDKVEFAKKVSFELTLEGTFLSMFNFFRCLSSVKYCLKYNQLYLNKNEQGLLACKLILDILQVA